MQVLHKENLLIGGLAGLKEHRLVVDKRIGGGDDTWDGLGNLVYLSDAYFNPFGETHMHSHHEIDIISIVLKGQINHEGSLEHGTSLQRGAAQVQHAGAEGFVHNEINPDPVKNRMIQIWVLPENKGESAGYKLYDVEQNKLTQIYGGSKEQDIAFDSHTMLDAGRFSKDKSFRKDGDFLTYITEGSAQLNDIAVYDGNLIRGTDMHFTAISSNVQVIVISKR